MSSELANSSRFAASYDPESPSFHDEVFKAPGEPWPWAQDLIEALEALPPGELLRRQSAADALLLERGITFTVYSDDGGTERIFPFDVLPRLITSNEWNRLERGLRQRMEALNLFVADVYGEQHCLRDRIIPEDLVLGNPAYRKACIGLEPPAGVWIHIAGTDLIRDAQGVAHVLEDNCRCPSGVSYVVENRLVLKRTLPRIFERMSVRAVDDYPLRLLEALRAVAPGGNPDPQVVVLTPGRYNSAYYEHTFLAQQMGVELVEGSDLVVEDGFVHMRTTKGLNRVDVIYRRIDDDFLDPTCFRPDSMLGVPGLMQAYQEGRVALANAPGTGIADDKAVYAFVPDLIRYYLEDEPIIPNVPTYLCARDDERAYVLEHLDELVVKAVDGAGGYGMLVGPHASAQERADFADIIRAKPTKYIAQPTLCLSRVPTLIDGTVQPRHVDLRPYILNSGESIYVQPGGLTRVALRKGSLVVNSSQGGGSKDTWVLSE
ncbi:MAG: circularly permuted type 2 ATP-grasp protein [Planctomycetota bacterium]|nr:MAG: circularly permuted type 2 ATP-grasp protein [Planctomycetota bacterium]